MEALAAVGCPKAEDAGRAVVDVTDGPAEANPTVEAGATKPNVGIEDTAFSFVPDEEGVADNEGVLSLDFEPKEKLIGAAAGTEVAESVEDVADGAPKLKEGVAAAFGVEEATTGSDKATGALVVPVGAGAELPGIPKEGKELEGAAVVPIAVVFELGKLKANLGTEAVKSVVGTVDKIGVVDPGKEKLKAGLGGDTEDEAGSVVPGDKVVLAGGAAAVKLNFGNSGAGTEVIPASTVSAD